MAKESTTTLRRHLDLALTADEELREAHAEAKNLREQVRQLDEKLSDNWLMLDHHEISEDEKDNERVINAWKFGMDGGVEICAGGMAYLASNALNSENEDLSRVAVVSALGDRGYGLCTGGILKFLL